MDKHHFISYSNNDALDFALQLALDLQAGAPPFRVWLDKNDIDPGRDWDAQTAEAIRACEALIFVMTPDSVEDQSVCKNEWLWSLKYKKPIVPLLLDRGAQMPFRLGLRQHIDFTGDRAQALAKLRKHLLWLKSPQGELQHMQDRLADANRDLRRASAADRPRIQDEIDLLKRQIDEQQRLVDNPQAAAQQTEKNIQTGLERERQPAKPVGGAARTKFINPPPDIAPTFFQDRAVETELVATFLQDQAERLLTIAGRAGIGKTAMVCRLLKALESGHLPDDLGPLSVDGIVYLSASGSPQINVPNLFADLCKLLPANRAQALGALYEDPQVSTTAKLKALLAEFLGGRTVVLLDNFEDLIDSATLGITNVELDEALRAVLNAPPHGVKVILTTRIIPRELLRIHAERQSKIYLDEGLESPHAENILRAMDASGKVGLKSAPDDLLDRARIYTRGYPRALVALYGILSADRYTTLEEVLSNPMPEDVVQALVGEAFERLDATAQRVMEALAVYERPVTPAAVDYLLRPYLPGIDSAAVLNRLVNMHFVRKEGNRHDQHPVDLAYALSHIPKGTVLDRQEQSDPPWTQYALLQRGAEYFKQARQPRETWKKLDDLGPQLNEFELRYAGGDYNTAAQVLFEIDVSYLMLWGHYHLVIELHERLQDKINDLELRSEILNRLGFAHNATRQELKAITYYEQAIIIARDANDRHDEAELLTNLGFGYTNLGQTARAIELYEQALAIAREIGDRPREGLDLANLGFGYANLGQTARAIELYEQALAIAREVGDHLSEGNHLGELGSSYATLGQTARAIEFYEQALAIAREIGDRYGEGWNLNNLGLCHAALGQTNHAIDFHEQALAIAREIGDFRGQGYHLGNLADALIDAERYGEAIQCAQESVRIGEEIDEPIIGCDGGRALAIAYMYAGDLSAAHAAAEAASQYNVPEYDHKALAILGIIALRQGDRTAAQRACGEAISHADKLLGQTPQFLNALDAKGLALAVLALCGDTARVPDAIAAYRAARAINSDAGIVKRALRLLDALMVVDDTGLLAEVRKVAAGSATD